MMTMSHVVSAGVFIDGRSAVLLSRLLADVVRQLGPGETLDELRPALIAIGRAAAQQRVRKHIARGTLCAERRGWAWVIDPSIHP
jgi:hypothetical protein